MVIRCENEGKMLAVLSKLESETDIRWVSGDKPTENVPIPMSFPVWLVTNRSNRMRYTEDISDVPFDDLTVSDDGYLNISTETTDDPVNHPSHYTDGKVECIDAMEQVFGTEAVKSFCLCNAFKYHWRHNKKNGDQDLQKAAWYMDYYRKLVNR